MRIEILGCGHRDIVNGSRFYDEQQQGLGNYFASYVYSELESLVVFAGVHVRYAGYYKTGKLKSRSVKLTGITVDGVAAGTLTTKGRATKEFVAEIK